MSPHTTPRRQQAEERSEVIGVRVTAEEKRELHRLAEADRRTPSSFLRNLLLRRLKPPRLRLKK